MESTGALCQGRTGSLSPSFHVISWNPDGTWESLEEVPGVPGRPQGQPTSREGTRLTEDPVMLGTLTGSQLWAPEPQQS